LRILHVITGLQRGGAETLLSRLIAATSDVHQHLVLCLAKPGPVSSEIEKNGQIVIHLGLNGHPFDSLQNIFRSYRAIKKFRPDLTHTWLYHANLIGGLAAKILFKTSVLWSFHNNYDLSGMKITTRIMVLLNRILASVIPDKMVFCSVSAKKSHVQAGFPSDFSIEIANGVDVKRFFRREGSALRENLDIPKDAPVVGMVARYSVEKDHRTFIRAASRLHQRHPNAVFVLCGQGISSENAKLMEEVKSRNIEGSFVFLDEFNPIENLYACFTIAALASRSEAFGLTLAEAMASEIPVVATNIDGIRELVEDHETLVKCGDDKAMSETWDRLLRCSPEQLNRMGKASRHRIERYFALEITVAAYLEVWKALAVKNSNRKQFSNIFRRRIT
jgi:glycosyltransferase involved in cell wall biosynthesis